MKKLISIDLKSELGFFKNPQFSGEKDSKHYSLNSIHKITLLGMFGSLLGLKGLNCTSKLNIYPEYYDELNHIQIGIEIKNPIRKQWMAFNSSSGLFSGEDGGVLNLSYQTLINPHYKIYLLLDLKKELEKELYDILKKNLIGSYGDIFMGKKPFSIVRDISESNFCEYKYKNISSHSGCVNTIFLGEYNLLISRFDKNTNKVTIGSFINKGTIDKHLSCVSLPVKYTELSKSLRYDSYQEFIFTNKEIEIKNESNNLFKLNNNEIVYLF